MTTVGRENRLLYGSYQTIWICLFLLYNLEQVLQGSLQIEFFSSQNGDVVLALTYFRVIFGRSKKEDVCQKNLPSRDTYITVGVSVRNLDYPSVGSHTYDHTVPWIPPPPEWVLILFHVLPHLTRSLFPSQAAILWSLFMSSSCRHQRPSYSFLSAWSISSHYFHRIKYFVSVSGVVCKKTAPHIFLFKQNNKKKTRQKQLNSLGSFH